jgi:fucose permease
MSFRAPVSLVLAGFWWFILVGASQSLNGPYETALKELGRLPEGGQGKLVAAFFAGSTAMILLTGWLSTKVPRLGLLWGVAGAFSMGALCASLAPAYGWLCVAAFLMGCGYGGLTVVFNAEFSLVFTGPRTTAWLSALNGFWGIGAVIGPKILGNYVRTPMVAHQWLAAGTLVGIALLAGVRRLGDMPKPEPGEKHAAMPVAIWAIAATMAIYVGTEVTTGARMADFLVTARNLNLEQATSLTSMMWLAFTVSRFALGPVTQWLTPPVLLATSTFGALGAVALIMAGWTQLGFVLLGVAMAPIFPALLGWATTLTATPHRASSLIIAAASLAAVMLPQVAAMSMSGDEARFPWVIGIGFCLLLALIAVLSRMVGKKLKKV